MSFIVYFALIAAIVVGKKDGPAGALLKVYLPALLIVPDGLRAITPGLPDPNFNQAAIIPLVFMVFKRYASRWKITFMDILVILYGTTVGYSDYLARGYADAQNLMFNMLFSVIAPYFVARLMISTEDMHVAVAKRFVYLMFFYALVGFYEAKFGMNPFHAIIGRTFFPGQGVGWVTTFRYGLARVAGPFSHAILAGIMVVIAFRLQRWLQWGGHWEPRFTLVKLPWDKARVITVVLWINALMTVARGPWIGAIIGAALVAVGRAKDRKKALRTALMVIVVGGAAGFYLLMQYLDIKPGAAMTMSQESALYRKVLFEKYFDIAADHFWLGWGLITWPKVPGMESIDNYFLLLSLMHGVPATLMLMTMMIWGAVQQVRRGMQEPEGAPPLAFSFAAMFIAVLVALGTVYMGEQVVPTFFFMLGWAQGWLLTPQLSLNLAARQAAAAGAGLREAAAAEEARNPDRDPTLVTPMPVTTRGQPARAATSLHGVAPARTGFRHVIR